MLGLLQCSGPQPQMLTGDNLTPPAAAPRVCATQGVGRALAVSALDVLGINPWSRLPSSEFRSLEGVREWLLAGMRISSPAARSALLPPLDEQSLASVLAEVPQLAPAAARRLAASVSKRAPAAAGGWAPPPPKVPTAVWRPQSTPADKAAEGGASAVASSSSRQLHRSSTEPKMRASSPSAPVKVPLLQQTSGKAGAASFSSRQVDRSLSLAGGGKARQPSPLASGASSSQRTAGAAGSRKKPLLPAGGTMDSGGRAERSGGSDGSDSGSSSRGDDSAWQVPADGLCVTGQALGLS